jgi:hypothetical protein
MPVRLLNSATPPLSTFYPDGSRRPLLATVVALVVLPAQAGDSSATDGGTDPPLRQYSPPALDSSSSSTRYRRSA